eukprot:1758745-Prymnesium_polylepis.1
MSVLSSIRAESLREEEEKESFKLPTPKEASKTELNLDVEKPRSVLGGRRVSLISRRDDDADVEPSTPGGAGRSFKSREESEKKAMRQLETRLDGRMDSLETKLDRVLQELRDVKRTLTDSAKPRVCGPIGIPMPFGR